MANIDIERWIVKPDVSVGHQNVDRTRTQLSHAAMLEYAFTVASLVRACGGIARSLLNVCSFLYTGMYRA